MPGRKKKHTAERLAKRPHRITPWKLAEAMPDVAERLESGSGGDEDILAALLEIMSSLGLESDKVLTKDGKTMERVDFHALVLAHLVVSGTGVVENMLKETLQKSIERNFCLHTLSERFEDDDAAEDKRLESAIKAEILQWKVCFDKAANDHKHEITSDREAVMLKWKVCFDKAVNDHKDAIIAVCYGGDTSSFVTEFDAYDATIEKFESRFIEARDDLQDVGQREIMDRLGTACLGVKLGMHKLIWVCWQCGKEAEKGKNKRNCCINCRAATYCSKECQLLHWKNCHRQTCRAIKPISAALEAELKTNFRSLRRSRCPQEENRCWTSSRRFPRRLVGFSQHGP